MPNALPIKLGERFHKLTVIGEPVSMGRGKLREVTCRCDCGAETVAKVSKLIHGRKRHCGACWDLSGTRAVAIKDGRSKRREHTTWNKMIKRCHDPSDQDYYLYGARGITVCDEWRADFWAFLRDAGRRPSRVHSIDRIDNSRGYEPGNVRWATATEQSRNRRNSYEITAFGETLCLQEWAERTGLDRETIKSRIRLGWEPERALTKKPQRCYHHVRREAQLEAAE
jgi:hypothetical protein